MRHRLNAKFAGVCARTGRPIKKGDPITYDTRTRRAYLDADPATTLAHQLDPDLTPDEAHAAGVYLRQAARRWVSDVYTIGGREYYQNKAGRCIDAPCCGCCNA